MPFIDDIKALMRISVSQTAFNTEITNLIAAAREDLKLSGVIIAKADSEVDPLITRAISVYCKANFGWDNPDSDKLAASYSMLKSHLTLSMDYAYYKVTFTVKVGVVPLEDATITFKSKILLTNSSGVAVFKGISEEQTIAYTVTKKGYLTVTGYVDVASDQAVSVAMVVI